MEQPFKVVENMVVRGSDGRKIGRVVSSNDVGFQIESGMFFHKEYFSAYSHINSLENNEIRLDCGLDLLQETEQFGAQAGDPLGTSFMNERDWNIRGEDQSWEDQDQKKRASPY